jgi:REP element-mobilizing transposase RayT
MKRFSAFYQLVYHFVWTTKRPLPLLTPTVEARLFPYLGSKCQELGYTLHAVNCRGGEINFLKSIYPMALADPTPKEA